VARWLADFGESWDRYEMELERVIDAGERVVSLFRIRAVGAGSGISVERDDAMVWTFRDGRLLPLDYFTSNRKLSKLSGCRSRAPAPPFSGTHRQVAPGRVGSANRLHNECIGLNPMDCE
jgi:hypothetical protein